MVVFTNGISDKGAYRKFKMRIPGNDDFAHMNEVILRRLKEDHLKKWGKPQLFLIDGGKGQLGAALAAMQLKQCDIPAIGLAKQYEQIVIALPQQGRRGSNVQLNEQVVTRLHGVIIERSIDFIVVQLPQSSHASKLLQRIRDESHRFAVSYHSVLKVKRQRASSLDDIPSIGPATKKLLLRQFGSYRGVVQARVWELEKVVGEKKAAIITQYTRADKKRVE
jgi:excinuclease ABC subunit C